MATDDAIRVILGNLGDRQELVIKALAINITAELQRTNPYLTGFSRASWIGGVGQPYRKTIDAKTESQKKEGANQAKGEQQAGLKRIAGYKIENGYVYISNNVSYIQALNSGSSIQQPAGFVQRAIVKTVKSLKL